MLASINHLLKIMSDYCSLGLAALRILCYNLYKVVCCVKDQPSKPEFNVLCLGLSGAGKTLCLAVLTKEGQETQPTVGFSIKAAHLSNCILNVKEIGGSEHVRPYWSRYYQHAQGLIFVVDGSDDLEIASQELKQAYSHTALSNLPILLLITHHDLENCRTADEVIEAMNLTRLAHPDAFVVHLCSSTDYESLRHGFTRFGHLLCPPSSS